ncbi:hypothetical protein AVEN_250253-1 [Araneus ventricosus]|uniref:Uncharacterized protein n=1 Tax=Araneus ventricosus TaxID=182803 RepID=A0A4Y2FHM8_ARAVE|nr:hypothetical protein AVEN_250253-1 [Araneus ventricosus]
MKSGKQKVDIPLCVVSYNLYKNGVDLLDNLIKTYFSSTQEKVVLTIIKKCICDITGLETLKTFPPDQVVELLEFIRHFTIAYLGLCVPRNVARMSLGIREKNQDYFKFPK